MDHTTHHKPSELRRLGFHYFRDMEKYSLSDAQFWFNQLKNLEADWLVLNNPENRAIPEEFIRQSVKQNINLIVDFNKQIGEYQGLTDIQTLIEVYGKWGVKYACLFREPNLRSSWGDTKWIRNDIVITHADLFIEFAQLCVENNIYPIFSPLHPGGDYLDRAFLERSLQILFKKSSPEIREQLILSAFGWHHGKTIFWERDPTSIDQNDRSPRQKLDHDGFRLFESYLNISSKVFHQMLPIIIFETGFQGPGNVVPHTYTNNRSRDLSAVIDLLAGRNVYDHQIPDRLIAPINKSVIAACVYILSSDHKSDAEAHYRWFTPQGKACPIAENFLSGGKEKSDHQLLDEKAVHAENHFKYRHYIYIDRPIKQKMHDILERLAPYMKKHKPVVGFSLLEAAKAAYLVIITDDKENFLKNQANILPESSIIKMTTLPELHELISS